MSAIASKLMSALALGGGLFAAGVERYNVRVTVVTADNAEGQR